MLAMRQICKDFGPVRVLFGVDFSLQKGEVHALIGENGAGKSTLMKILSGYEAPTAGAIHLLGEPVAFAEGRDAEDKGIVMIHQEFNLADDLTVEANIFLGRELRQGAFLDRRRMWEQARRILQELECQVDPDAVVGTLSVSEKQMVEIAKAVSRNARILIMDEPTAVLPPSDVEVLFRLIRRLRDGGIAIVYISHKLGEVKAIADRVTVLRDGHLVTTRSTAQLSQEEMANLMVGRELKDMYPPKGAPLSDDVVFAAEGVSVPGWAQRVSFTLRKGEILGFAGLVGAGRTQLMEGIVGLRPRSEGTLYRHGQQVDIQTLQDAIDAGMMYLTEDRKGKGLLVSMPLRPNLTLLSLREYARPFIDERREQDALQRAVNEFDIRVPHLETEAYTLSGGNQQKLVLAKIMQVKPDIIILDEPTRGIDVGTKSQIYHFVKELTKQGRSCILISSELPEIIGLSHRVAVMHAGTLTGILEGEQLNEETIMQYATGLKGVASHAAPA